MELDLTDIVTSVHSGKIIKCDECGGKIRNAEQFYYSEWGLTHGTSHPTSWFNFCQGCVEKYRSIPSKV